MNSVMVSMVIIIIFFLPKDQVLLDRTLLNLEDPRKRKMSRILKFYFVFKSKQTPIF